MGRAASERERLSLQDRVFAPHSQNLFRQAGITTGARVLDVGCGVGDTSRLLADLVGPSGSVIGVDHDPESLRVAAELTEGTGLTNIRFEQQDLAHLELDGPVDALAGRLILIHLDDPTATLRHLRRWVRPGGVVAFQEITCHRARSVPEIPLMNDWVRWVSAGLSQAGADPDIGDRLPAILRGAGFGDVEAVSVSIAGDGAGAIPTYLAQTVESLTPMILRSGTATTEDLDRDLAAVIAAQARERQAMLYIQELAAAWARVPLSPVAGAPGSAPGW